MSASKTKKANQSVVFCKYCGTMSLTAKKACPFCQVSSCLYRFDWQPSDETERQMITALLMWSRVRADKKSGKGDIGRASFRRVWKKAWDVLKFWDQAIKLENKIKKKGGKK